jgi:hypothetical protein
MSKVLKSAVFCTAILSFALVNAFSQNDSQSLSGYFVDLDSISPTIPGVVREQDLNSALLDAALKGDAKKMEEYIHRGADVNFVQPIDGREFIGDGINGKLPFTVLLAAILSDNPEAVKVALDSGADPFLRFAWEVKGTEKYAVNYLPFAIRNPDIFDLLLSPKYGFDFKVDKQSIDAALFALVEFFVDEDIDAKQWPVFLDMMSRLLNEYGADPNKMVSYFGMREDNRFAAIFSNACYPVSKCFINIYGADGVACEVSRDKILKGLEALKVLEPLPEERKCHFTRLTYDGEVDFKPLELGVDYIYGRLTSPLLMCE